MAKVRKNIKPVRSTFTSPFNIYWTKQNFLFLVLGILTIIVGFYLMSLGNWDNPLSLVASPILLAIGYFVLLPLSVFYRKKEKNSTVE